MPDKKDYRLSHRNKGEDYDAGLQRDHWSAYMAARERAILAKVVPNLLHGRIPRYLDFACGTGRLTEFMETMSEASYGVDVSASMVEIARRKCSSTTFILKDITREHLELERVNLVTAFRFFGNAQDELRLSALRALHHLLVPRGYLIINSHRNGLSINNLLLRCIGQRPQLDLSHYKLARLLVQSKFRVLHTYPVGFWLFRYRWHSPRFLNSPFARFLERVCCFGFLAPFSPDAVVVAQKIE